MTTQRFDNILVGAGAAGAVIAARLTEDPSRRVLVLEAGPRNLHPLIKIPMGHARLNYTASLWPLDTVGQTELDDRRLAFVQGRGLGGSTAVNGMIQVRGNPADFDAWVEAGNDEWSYQDVLTFYRRAEDNPRLADDPAHAEGSGVHVEPIAQPNPVTLAFLEAADELGVAHRDDLNGALQEGVGLYDLSRQDGRRMSVSKAYLNPAEERPNLSVHTDSRVTRLLLRQGRVEGVEYVHRGQTHRAYAEHEVIVAGGVVSTPQLLLLSGIGPADQLVRAGVTVLHDLPGVGRDLQDHLDIPMGLATIPVSYNNLKRPLRAAFEGLHYLMTGMGPLSTSLVEGGMFVRTGDDPRPDVQVHALPVMDSRFYGRPVGAHGMTLNACYLQPTSRGTITLNPDDPHGDPIIDPRYNTIQDDWEGCVRAVSMAQEVAKTKALATIVTESFLPGPTDAERRTAIRQLGQSAHHPVGTCRMGTDPLAVVDQHLAVHGLEGLRIVDASVMPRVTNGNTQATATMIGERGAQFILDAS